MNCISLLLLILYVNFRIAQESQSTDEDGESNYKDTLLQVRTKCDKSTNGEYKFVSQNQLRVTCGSNFKMVVVNLGEMFVDSATITVLLDRRMAFTPKENISALLELPDGVVRVGSTGLNGLEPNSEQDISNQFANEEIPIDLNAQPCTVGRLLVVLSTINGSRIVFDQAMLDGSSDCSTDGTVSMNAKIVSANLTFREHPTSKTLVADLTEVISQISLEGIPRANYSSWRSGYGVAVFLRRGCTEQNYGRENEPYSGQNDRNQSDGTNRPRYSASSETLRSSHCSNPDITIMDEPLALFSATNNNEDMQRQIEQTGNLKLDPERQCLQCGSWATLRISYDPLHSMDTSADRSQYNISVDVRVKCPRDYRWSAKEAIDLLPELSSEPQEKLRIRKCRWNGNGNVNLLRFQNSDSGVNNIGRFHEALKISPLQPLSTNRGYQTFENLTKEQDKLAREGYGRLRLVILSTKQQRNCENIFKKQRVLEEDLGGYFKRAASRSEYNSDRCFTSIIRNFVRDSNTVLNLEAWMAVRDECAGSAIIENIFNTYKDTGYLRLIRELKTIDDLRETLNSYYGFRSSSTYWSMQSSNVSRSSNISTLKEQINRAEKSSERMLARVSERLIAFNSGADKGICPRYIHHFTRSGSNSYSRELPRVIAMNRYLTEAIKDRIQVLQGGGYRAECDDNLPQSLCHQLAILQFLYSKQGYRLNRDIRKELTNKLEPVSGATLREREVLRSVLSNINITINATANLDYLSYCNAADALRWSQPAPVYYKVIKGQILRAIRNPLKPQGAFCWKPILTGDCQNCYGIRPTTIYSSSSGNYHDGFRAGYSGNYYNSYNYNSYNRNSYNRNSFYGNSYNRNWYNGNSNWRNSYYGNSYNGNSFYRSSNYGNSYYSSNNRGSMYGPYNNNYNSYSSNSYTRSQGFNYKNRNTGGSYSYTRSPLSSYNTRRATTRSF